MRFSDVTKVVIFWSAIACCGTVSAQQQRTRLNLNQVDLHADISYAGTDNPRQKLDLLLPKTRKDDTRLPVVVFIHGGAWRAGDKTGGRRRVAPYVATGKFAGVTVGYRLSGEAIWPAQIHDCKAAIRWIKAHADEHRLDADKIAVWGSSAGGHLVAMLGVTGDVPELEGKLGPHTDQNSSVNYVIDEYGPTDFLTMNDFPSRIDHDSPQSPESKLIAGAIQENKEKARAACPLKYVSKDDATFLIIHGDKDPLVPFNQSEQLQAALKKAERSVTLVKMVNGEHGGFRSPDYAARIESFLNRHLLGDETSKVSAEPIVLEQ